MGCDIHCVVERRVGEKWIAVGLPGSFHRSAYHQYDYASSVAKSRNYKRFAALAGVRGDGPEPRGIPDDISETTAFLIADIGVDGHSHSWLPLNEAIKIFSDTENWPENQKQDEWPRAYPASLFFEVENDEVEMHRLVFWFDN